METDNESSVYNGNNCKLELQQCSRPNSASESKMTINLQDSRSYLATDKVPTWWEKRTTLEKKLVVFGAIIIVLCLGFLIALVSFATRASVENNIAQLIKSAFWQSEIDQQKNKLCTTTGCLSAASQIMQSMDQDIDPCEDFYNFACRKWVENHPIPVDKSGLEVFSVLTEKLMMDLRNEIEKPKKPDEGLAIHTTKEIYSACMNEAVADNFGLSYFLNWMQEFGGWPLALKNWNSTDFDWKEVNIRLMKEASSYFLSASVSTDAKNTSTNVIYVGLAGTVIQTEYLLNPDKYENILEAYRNIIRTMVGIIGHNHTDTETDIEEMIQFETELANITKRHTEDISEDLSQYYNKITISQLNNITQQKMDWLNFMNELFDDIRNITEDDKVIVTLPEMLTEFLDYFQTVSNRTKANYMMWRYSVKYSWYINNMTRDAIFQFQKVVSGIEVPSPRWINCVNIANEFLGEVTGSIYVRKFVQKDTKVQAETMITDIKNMVDNVLSHNVWMDQSTLEKAKEKATAMMEFVAYPDWSFNNTYLDEMYQDLTSSPVNIVNYHNILLLMSNYSRQDINEAVSRDVWITPPSTVNAFYSPTTNAIFFPAGILQPPFFSPTNLKAVNYGAIGSVIGHEITHGFDNEGRQNDENGNMVEWWTNASADAYSVRANCIREQYSHYCNEKLKTDLELTKTPCVDSNNTLGENIADNGGLKVAFQAYQRWVKRNGVEPRLPGLNKYSPEQLFFISFAQVWCDNSRPQKLFQTIMYDSHSPQQYRVQGVLANSEDFAKAFQCEPKTPMNPTKKCSFW